MEEERTDNAAPVDAQVEDAEMMERLQEEIRNLPVVEHLLFMMQSLSALAVGRMGLSEDPKARTDLEQARLAIDAFRALTEVMERAKPEQAAAHRGALSQLQLAYVSAVNAAGLGASPAEPKVEERP